MEAFLIFDFEELEKRCRRYRRKRLFLKGSVLILGIASFFAIYSLLYTKKKHTPLPTSTPTLASSSSSQSEAPKKRCVALQLLYSNDAHLDSVIKYQNMVQRKGFSCFIKRGELDERKNRKLYLLCNVARKKSDLLPWIAKAKKEGLDYIVVNSACQRVMKSGKKRSKIQRKNSDNIQKPSPLQKVRIETKNVGIEDLKKLFEQKRSYDLAMKIATLYYQKEDFTNALAWARKANRLDRRREGAWLLYAKSLYNLGNKEQARELLKVFINYQRSAKAERLLKKWSDR